MFRKLITSFKRGNNGIEEIKTYVAEYSVSDASERLSTTRVGNSIYQIVKSTNYAEKLQCLVTQNTEGN